MIKHNGILIPFIDEENLDNILHSPDNTSRNSESNSVNVCVTPEQPVVCTGSYGTHHWTTV